MTLRYLWWDRWGSLQRRAYNQPAAKVTAALDVAAWFIEEHAHDAEHHGWRPVHLMHPAHGIAWRWWSIPEPVVTFSKGALIATIGQFPFTYSAHADGSVSFLTGPSRESVL